MQGAAALATAIATVVLVRVTARYVALTSNLATVSAQQLSALVQPKLELVLGASYPLHIGRVQVRITNIGEHPTKLWNVLIAFGTRKAGLVYPIHDAEQRVLNPRDAFEQIVDLAPRERELACVEDPNAAMGWAYRRPLQLAVDCTDIAGVSRHCFYFVDGHGLHHKTGFHNDPKPKKPQSSAFATFAQRVIAAKERIDDWVERTDARMNRDRTP